MNVSRRLRSRKKPGFDRHPVFQAPRAGATLTEVLMALLIMAVGIVSVFTLFPISILLSIQSTKLTNARLHKTNAEHTIYSAAARGLNFTSPVRGALPLPNGWPRFQGEWQPRNQYFPGDVCVPTVKPGGAFPSPHVWFVCTQSQDGAGMTPGRSAAAEPRWVAGSATAVTFDNEVIWMPLSFIQLERASGRMLFPPMNSTPNPIVRTDRYVVDPLGFNVADSELLAPNPFEFGNKTNRLTQTGMSLWDIDPNAPVLLRINSGYTDELSAMAETVLQDSWETLVEATPINVTPTTVEFPPTIDLSGLNLGYSRVVLTSTDGRASATRTITARAGATLSWNTLTPLPAALDSPDEVGLARVETFDRRYTWFATVRKDLAGNAEIKVVITFKRRFVAEEEHVFDSNFGNFNVDLDGDGQEDGLQHGLGTAASPRGDWVKIVWAGAPGGTEPDPVLKPGNWLFDAAEVDWYRIQEIHGSGTTAGRRWAVLILDSSVRRQTQLDPSNPPNPVRPGRAILMRGIVEIFDL